MWASEWWARRDRGQPFPSLGFEFELTLTRLVGRIKVSPPSGQSFRGGFTVGEVEQQLARG